MNLLKNKLPSAVEVGGISYKIDTGFDTALSILDLMKDKEDLFTAKERIEMVLDMFYVDDRPKSEELALALMYRFLNLGEDFGSPAPTKKEKRIMDFDVDGNAIYTHFYRVYGIDLQEQRIHWWKFNAMLKDNGAKTSLQSLIDIRTMKLEDIPEEKRMEMARIQRECSLDSTHIDPVETLEERNRRWKEG